MADPLSITASVLAVVTAAVKSTQSLYETVQRFKGRNKTLQRLQDELGDLAKILDLVTQVINDETFMLEILQGPINRCNQVCHEFEQSMRVFDGKSKPGIRDWTRMEFRRGDINEFIDTVAGYKSTISVGLGTIAMRTSKVSHKVLQEYNEMVQDTAYNLQLHLQRIDEKMARFTNEEINCSEANIDLKDERAVIEQCLRICDDAKSYLESLTNRESSLLEGASKDASEDYIQGCFEAQLLTRRALNENRDSFADIIGRLQERLRSQVLNGEPRNSNERLQLQEDIDISKQCLEVCKVASEVSHQKIYRVGEVTADGDSDQVVVNTMSDLFDVKKAQSKGNAAQLVGSMTGESLQHLAKERYNTNRFRRLVDDSNSAQTNTTSSPPVFEAQTRKHVPLETFNNGQPPTPEPGRKRPSPNEMRKRMMDGEMD